jgi:thioredoxin 1
MKVHHSMRIGIRKSVKGLLGLALLFLLLVPSLQASAASPEVPVKGMVTLLDLGAGTCIPCKLMAPILQKLEKEYVGKAAVVFIDINKDRTPIKRFGLRAIPTQIFFDKEGAEVYRHEGFLSEEEIVSQFKKMGVK